MPAALPGAALPQGWLLVQTHSLEAEMLDCGSGCCCRSVSNHSLLLLLFLLQPELVLLSITHAIRLATQPGAALPQRRSGNSAHAAAVPAAIAS